MESSKLREIIVYYSNGGKDNKPFVTGVNMASHVTDEQIKQYYAKGKVFNVGCAEFDLMATVEKVEIIK